MCKSCGQKFRPRHYAVMNGRRFEYCCETFNHRISLEQGLLPGEECQKGLQMVTHNHLSHWVTPPQVRQP